ncbi:hypothetical protein AERO9A_170007 [Aeromonas salmonicida]|nr:hypothetical protein AERO9A_170007 [Aeromonas salmonicida]
MFFTLIAGLRYWPIAGQPGCRSGGHAMVHHPRHQHPVELLVLIEVDGIWVAQHPQLVPLIVRMIGRMHMVMVVETKAQRLVEAQPPDGNLILWRINLQDNGAPRRLAEVSQQAGAMVLAAQGRIDGQMLDIDLLAAGPPEDEAEQQVALIKELTVKVRIRHLDLLMLRLALLVVRKAAAIDLPDQRPVWMGYLSHYFTSTHSSTPWQNNSDITFGTRVHPHF